MYLTLLCTYKAWKEAPGALQYIYDCNETGTMHDWQDVPDETIPLE